MPLGEVLARAQSFTYWWSYNVSESKVWDAFGSPAGKEAIRGLVTMFMISSYSKLILSFAWSQYYVPSLPKMIALSESLNSEIV